MTDMTRRGFIKLFGLATASIALQADPILSAAARLAEQHPTLRVMFYKVKNIKNGKWYVKCTKWSDIQKRKLSATTWDTNSFEVLGFDDHSKVMETRNMYWKQHIDRPIPSGGINIHGSITGARKTAAILKSDKDRLQQARNNSGKSKSERNTYLKENHPEIWKELHQPAVEGSRAWRSQNTDKWKEGCHKGGVTAMKKMTREQRVKGTLNLIERLKSEGYYESDKFLDGCSKGGKTAVENGQLERMRQNAYKEVECPHCKKKGMKRIMMRWHFDKCKTINEQNC